MTESRGNSGLPAPKMNETVEVVVSTGLPARPTTTAPLTGRPKPAAALPTSEEIAAKQQRLRDRLARGQKSMDEVDRKQTALAAELERMRQLNRELLGQRDQLQEENNRIKTALTVANTQISDYNAAHIQMQREQKDLQTRYRALAEMNVGNFEYLEEIMAGVEDLAAKAEKTASNTSTVIEEQDSDETDPYNGADEG